MRGFPGQTPNPSAVNATEGAGISIAAGAGTIIGTAPAIKGGDVPKMITYTGGILYGGAEIVTLTAERDGTPFGSAYVTGSIAGGETVLTTSHWYDDTPGKGEPVYTVRAVGSAGAVGAATIGRTITVHNV